MLDKTELFDKMFEMLQGFHHDYKEEITNDEPIQGSDAVDYLVDFWNDVDKLFEELNA